MFATAAILEWKNAVESNKTRASRRMEIEFMVLETND
jgi:hypothetical protein